jgi:phage protein D
MLTPGYKLTIGKTTVDSTTQPRAGTAVDLVVRLDMEISADSFTIVLGDVGGHLKAAMGEKVTVALGYADGGGLIQVIAGSVVSLEPSLNTTRVVGYTAAETLLRSYLDATYENNTAGAIVRDLAGKARVTVANAEDGIQFPVYVIDGRRSFCNHIRSLADFCGFDSYFNSQGELVFAKFAKPNAVHLFEHAKDILELQVTHSLPLAGTVQTWGESPTDNKGPGASAWLTKNFARSRGTSGSGKPILLLERPALRTRDAAQTAAAADAIRIRRATLRGRLVSVGRPEVKLGDAVELRALPDAALNKTFQVRAVTHRISKRGGFTTEVNFWAI